MTVFEMCGFRSERQSCKNAQCLTTLLSLVFAMRPRKMVQIQIVSCATDDPRAQSDDEHPSPIAPLPKITVNRLLFYEREDENSCCRAIHVPRYL